MPASAALVHKARMPSPLDAFHGLLDPHAAALRLDQREAPAASIGARPVYTAGARRVHRTRGRSETTSAWRASAERPYLLSGVEGRNLLKGAMTTVNMDDLAKAVVKVGDGRGNP